MMLGANGHCKFMYDSIRIVGLRMSSFLNESLIKLHHAPDQPELKSRLVRTAIVLISCTRLYWPNDKHAAANLYNLQYSFSKF